MFIRSNKVWHLPERLVTAEGHFWNRREILRKTGIMAGGLVAGSLVGGWGEADSKTGSQQQTSGDPSASLYPVERNAAFPESRPLTAEKLATSYNNFYEFGTTKNIVKDAQALPIRPWQIRITGDVQKEMVIDIDDLLKRMPLEERIYRHRCVETWSMVVPWSGFPLKALVDLAQPLSSARYIQMETFKNRKVAPGQLQVWFPWPYVEGLTIEEATNDLAFLVTGVYGKPLPKQNGAPLRLAVPWKYGFKSIKSIVEFKFTSKRPVSFWEEVAGNEYGFWANVNPQVPHPRWSQAFEEPLGSNEKIPTELYNGYAEQVASLYAGMTNEKLFF